MQSPWNTLLDHWCHEVQIYYVSQQGCWLSAGFCCMVIVCTVGKLLYHTWGFVAFVAFMLYLADGYIQVLKLWTMWIVVTLCNHKTSVKICWPVSHWLLLFQQVDVKNSGVMSKLLGAGAVMVGQLFMLRIATIGIFLLHYSSALQKRASQTTSLSPLIRRWAINRLHVLAKCWCS